MPNCDFYALAPDVTAVLDFVFAQPGWRLVELASRHDQPLRYFGRTEEVLRAFPELGGLARPVHLQLHVEPARGAIIEQRIDFAPGAVPGATHRYDSRGWGLIQLYFGALRAGRLAPSHTNHNTEARALRWSGALRSIDPVSAWDWAEVTRASSRLNRFLRRTAAGKVGSRPVLPAAAAARASGELEFALAG